MIGFVVFSIKRAWQGFWRNAVMSLAATATMVLMLLLLAGFWVINTGLLAGLEFTEKKVNVVADLYDNVTPFQIQALRAKVEAMPEVDVVVFVSREDALKRFRENRHAQGEEDLTRFLDTNPFHQSLEIALTDAALYSSVYDRLVVEPTVQVVKNQQDLVERVLTVTNFLRNAGGVILAVIGVIVLFIIINTIRLAVVARAEEIDIMRLVGASDSFIRWPFVFEGALVGLFGASLALVVLAAAADPLGGFMYDFFRVLPLTFGTLSKDVAVLVFGTGVGLGVIGSWVSVRTYLIR
ncbi:MAG: ABC transporter permease [Chloroflexota bacterium]|nr:ABC transporter permease [Chloroflexota bacterium]